MMIIDDHYKRLDYRFTECKLKRQLLPENIIEILPSIISDDCNVEQSSWSYTTDEDYTNTADAYGNESLQRLATALKHKDIFDVRCYYRVKRGRIMVEFTPYTNSIGIGYKPDIVDDNLIPDEITQFIDYLREFDEQPEPDRSKKAP